MGVLILFIISYNTFVMSIRVWNYPSFANIRIPDSISFSYPDIRISVY